MKFGLVALLLGVSIGMVHAADPEPASSEKPKANSSVEQKIDRRKHPAEVKAVPGTSVGRPDSQQGSSVGIGVSIPLHKTHTPDVEPQEDSD